MPIPPAPPPISTQSRNYAWTIASATGGILHYNHADFALDTSGFTNPLHGAFDITNTGNALQLTYTATAVPEPATWA